MKEHRHRKVMHAGLCPSRSTLHLSPTALCPEGLINSQLYLLPCPLAGDREVTIFAWLPPYQPVQS